MKFYDINEFVSHVFGGLTVGMMIGGQAGKTIKWMFIGGIVCGIFWATNYIRDRIKKRQNEIKDQP